MRRSSLPSSVRVGIIVYGISAFSLSQDLGVSTEEAKAYMDAYFARFDPASPVPPHWWTIQSSSFYRGEGPAAQRGPLPTASEN